MTATATVEKSVSAEDQRKVTHRNACAYLKGFIVGYSKRHGMRWDGDPERTEAFTRGFEDSRYVGPGTVTFAHVVHNRLRHGRPHLGGERRDEEFIEGFRQRCLAGTKLLAVLAEYGVDVKEVL